MSSPSSPLQIPFPFLSQSFYPVLPPLDVSYMSLTDSWPCLSLNLVVPYLSLACPLPVPFLFLTCPLPVPYLFLTCPLPVPYLLSLTHPCPLPCPLLLHYRARPYRNSSCLQLLTHPWDSLASRGNTPLPKPEKSDII